MSFEERLGETKAKMDELKARFNETIESAKKADQLKKDEILVKIAKMDAAIEDFGRDIEAQVYCDVTSMKEEAKSDIDAIGKAIDELNTKAIDKTYDNIAAVDGAINAAEENSRLAREQYESKLNSTLLKAQMNVEAAKAKVDAQKEAVDKVAMEKRINDLLDYADGCQQLSLVYAMEAELAILEACDEIEAFDAKYGNKEN
jgi:F0F1-type ATP synthase membrane subunit b/b'